MTDEHPLDRGIYRCEACGAEIPGERYEPPLDHRYDCVDWEQGDLVFEEDGK